MNLDAPEYMDYFLDLSAVATGYSRFDLQATGQASLYFDTVRGVIGGDLFGELLQVFHEHGLDPILVSPKLGPVARNIIKLWYISIWETLPPIWQEKFGVSLNDATFMADPYAYPEGLLWKTLEVNPPAAKPPGYGIWALPPRAQWHKS